MTFDTLTDFYSTVLKGLKSTDTVDNRTDKLILDSIYIGVNIDM